MTTLTDDYEYRATDSAGTKLAVLTDGATPPTKYEKYAFVKEDGKQAGIPGAPLIFGADSIEVAITLSLDTNIYADGDVLFDTQELASAVRVAAGYTWLTHVEINDKDDQGQPLDLVFFNQNTSLGTENSAPSITDANLDNKVGRVQVFAADYYDFGGAKCATVQPAGGPLHMKVASGTSLYVGGISRGTGTYPTGATAMTAKFYFTRD